MSSPATPPDRSQDASPRKRPSPTDADDAADRLERNTAVQGDDEGRAPDIERTEDHPVQPGSSPSNPVDDSQRR
jgi:hypothetical protein